MQHHDLTGRLASLPNLDLASRPTEEEARAAAPLLGAFNQCEVRLVRFSGQPPWERHPDDELIHLLEGDLEVTLLEGEDRREVALRASSLLVIPAGTWHRSRAAQPVALLAVTSASGNDSSMADDPRG